MPASNVSRTANDPGVDVGAAADIVRFDRQHLLQCVGRAVCLERPHFHFAEALAAELRLAAQRLLGHQAVRTDGAGMDLVVDQDGAASTYRCSRP